MTRALTCVFTASNSPYLSAECTGLGNVLFQIAAVYGVSKETGRAVEFIDLKNFTSKLRSLTGLDYMTTIFRNLPIHSEFEYTMRCDVNHHYTGNFKQELVDFVNNNSHNIYLNGHFESPLFFSSCETEMKTMLSPDHESLQYIQSKYPVIFEKDCCIIHIRTHHPGFMDDVEYIKRAMSQLPKLTYVVISNSIEIARKTLEPLGEEFIFCEDNPDYIDLWIMSLCKYNIMSHSTMSWWGAFLNIHEDKVIMYPKTMETFYPGPLSNLYFKTYIPL
jgi:hypothetical protein